eukprot:1647875-Amphidinium_carterae.2
MDQQTTIVLRVQLTMQLHGKGHWMPPAPTVKDFRQLLDERVWGMTCDIWQASGMTLHGQHSYE